jgi:hypothetical protein
MAILSLIFASKFTALHPIKWIRIKYSLNLNIHIKWIYIF